MPHIKVYHNPHFLDYDGDHRQIVPPIQPVASVFVPEAYSLNERLGAAYARTQHGYSHSSWFHDPQVIPHLRSTAVGDLLATTAGIYTWSNLLVSNFINRRALTPWLNWPKHTSDWKRLARN